MEIREFGTIRVKARTRQDLIQVGLELPERVTIKPTIINPEQQAIPIKTRLCEWCKRGIQTFVRAPQWSKLHGNFHCWVCGHNTAVERRRARPSNAWEERRKSNIAYAFPQHALKAAGIHQ